MKSKRKKSLWPAIGLVFLFAMVALPVYGAVIIHPIVSPDFNFRKEIQATASESPFFGFEFGFLGWDESNSAGIEPGMKPS